MSVGVCDGDITCHINSVSGTPRAHCWLQLSLSTRSLLITEIDFFSCTAKNLIGVCFGFFFIEFVVVVFFHFFLLLLLESVAQGSEFLLQRPENASRLLNDWQETVTVAEHRTTLSTSCRLSIAFIKRHLKAPRG